MLSPRQPVHYHFSGIAGAGMNPLAQLMRARGHKVQGSDRSLDQGKNQEVAAHLRRLGIELRPHGGSAIARDIDRFVYSTAVEADTPEMRAARAMGIDLVPPAGPPGRGGEGGPARGGGRGLTPSGIRVVDDYAHNGEKLRAALTTAQVGRGRVVRQASLEKTAVLGGGSRALRLAS